MAELFNNIQTLQKQEAFRYTPLQKINLNQFAAKALSASYTFDPKKMAPFFQPAATLVLGETPTLHTKFDISIEPLPKHLKLHTNSDALEASSLQPKIIFLQIGAQQNLTNPIVIVHPPQENLSANATCLVIEVLENTTCTFLQHHVGNSAVASLYLTQTHVFLREAAQCEFGVLNQHTHAHFGDWFFEQKQNSSLKTYFFNHHNAFSRTNLFFKLTEPNATLEAYALSNTHQKNNHEMHAEIVHTSPHTTSQTLFKNILTDQSSSTFRGKICVKPHAQKTQSFLLNRNLLLSPEAEINSMPQLEIEADDVKCSHGSTTGELNADELFYLRSRGLSEKDAKHLLVQSFAGEIFGKIKHESLKLFLEQECFEP